ncbi:MAG: hypothetical protein NVSMB52_15120 [Chloroflexota bacterium]
MVVDSKRPPLRVLMVQMTPHQSAEVSVVRSLLETGAEIGMHLKILVIQGVAGAHAGREVADTFHQIPNVTVCEVPVGLLGRSSRNRLDKARKLCHAARLQYQLPKLRRMASVFHPDVIYSSQQIWDVRLARPLSQALNCPQVVHLHYTVGPWLGRRALETLRKADMVIAVSDFIRDDAVEHGVLPQRVHTLYNTVSVEPVCTPNVQAQNRAALCHELGLPATTILLGMVGRINPWKGQEDLLYAAIPLLQRMPHLALLLIGAEDDAGKGLGAHLRTIAYQAGVVDQVLLVGHRSDVPRILKALHLFAHPSHHDPCPLAVLEAMAHGLPVVAWREGGTESLVADGTTGLLVESNDRQSLTRALVTLLDDPDKREWMGMQARRRVAADFLPTDAARSFIGMLESACRWPVS